MSAELAYVDATALVKALVNEPESAALASEILSWKAVVTADIGVVETVRAVQRAAPDEVARIRDVFAAQKIRQIPMSLQVRQLACAITPEDLGSLAAVHLATAEMLRAALGVVFTYDEDLAAAAVARGLPVRSPA